MMSFGEDYMLWGKMFIFGKFYWKEIELWMSDDKSLFLLEILVYIFMFKPRDPFFSLCSICIVLFNCLCTDQPGIKIIENLQGCAVLFPIVVIQILLYETFFCVWIG